MLKQITGGKLSLHEPVLIIEDEFAIQSILSELLADAGYDIEVAGDGLEGITKFKEDVYKRQAHE